VSGSQQVFVVIGVGGMGKAIARRAGSGKTVLLADFNETTLHAAATELRADGFTVETRTVDVSKEDSVRSLAKAAANLGPVVQIAHTAGLSPVQASVPAIIAVDLVGVAIVLDEFAEVVAPGGAAVVISSMAGAFSTFSPDAEQLHALMHSPSGELAALPFLSSEAIDDSTSAYGLAKRCNQLRVQAASTVWGARGARVNTISPGIISTPMAHEELSGPSGDFMRLMIEKSGAQRLGTTEDIAAAAAFLLGPESTFVTGTDLLVDGGVVAASRNGALSVSATDS
jgi:NAD(P)-dependent dehydrogenase (short-subunit alcohol dehydrogenase family)